MEAALVGRFRLRGCVNRLTQPFNVGLLTSAHDSLITRSRNGLVKTFLDNPTATHVFIDDFDGRASLEIAQYGFADAATQAEAAAE